jgi:hypothetical protein
MPRTAEAHVSTLAHGLKMVVEAMLVTSTGDTVKMGLIRLLRKLDHFYLSPHCERQLAVHTARTLLDLSSVASTYEFGDQHERTMQVPRRCA